MQRRDSHLIFRQKRLGIFYFLPLPEKSTIVASGTRPILMPWFVECPWSGSHRDGAMLWVQIITVESWIQENLGVMIKSFGWSWKATLPGTEQSTTAPRARWHGSQPRKPISRYSQHRSLFIPTMATKFQIIWISSFVWHTMNGHISWCPRGKVL